MIRIIYTVIFYLAIPFIYAFFWFKGRQNHEYRQGFAQRMGWYGEKSLLSPSIIIHCASVGEVVLATPLVNALQNQNPNFKIIVTTMTPTGANKVYDIFGNSVLHLYLPFDVPCAIKRFFKFTQPQLVIIIETEIWANFFNALKNRKIPLIIANARISPHSFPRYAKFKGSLAPILNCTTVIATQDQSSYERYLTLGTSREKLQIMGNLKYDLPPPANIEIQIEELHALVGNRPLWVAGSTHEQEEELILETHKLLQSKYPDLLLVLVPRHIERQGEVAQIIAKKNLSFVRRSQTNTSLPTSTAVLLVDKIGELIPWYALAKVAFVGGSLIPRGGHNPLEPLLFKTPVISGKEVFNFAEIYQDLDRAHCVYWVENNVNSIYHGVNELLNSPKLSQTMAENGAQVLQANQGALQNLLQILHPWLS